MRHLALAVTAVALLADGALADRQKAEQLFRAGARAYKAQQFLDAAEQFEAAYKEFDAPEIAFSVAQSYRRAYATTRNADHAHIAIDYYKKYLVKVPTGGRSGDAHQSIDELEHALSTPADKSTHQPLETNEARLGVSVTFADQQVTSGLDLDEQTAAMQIPVRVWIDREQLQPDRFYPVKPGDHVVRGEADGYQPYERKVHLIQADTQNAELVLQPMPAKVIVKTEAGARIVVDGRSAKPGRLELPAGKHLIAVLRKGRAAAATEVVVRRAEERVVVVPLEKSWRRRAVPYAIGGSIVGAGVAVFGAAGVWQFGRLAREKRDLLLTGNQDPQVVSDYNTWRDRRAEARTLTWIGAGTAVAFGLAAWGLYHFDTPSAEGVRIEPMATPGGAGAVVSGTF
jgi:hypothetical protein